MAGWDTEDEFAAAAAGHSLPTPTDTPYRTPSRGSRRSSRHKSNSPGPSSSPPPLPSNERNKRLSRDVANDETISILDPRRFTPTLHANLVSEILALRRDGEEKGRLIESLENDLHNTRGEREEWDASLQTTSKENRSLKRQLALLEGGTSSALSELARERDEAADALSETKRRLEVAQKKARTQEEEADRVQDLWTRDKDNWEEEKRKYERKIHVSEGRLKAVLEEVAAYQANHHGGSFLESETDDLPKETVNGHGSDTGSVRSMSMTNSIRFSTINGMNGHGGAKLNGKTLADELDFDDDESQTDQDGRESVMSIRHNRNQSRESVFTKRHRRDQSYETRPASVARGKLQTNQIVLDRLEGNILEDDETAQPKKFEYTDAAVQYSPPPSPKLAILETLIPVEPSALHGTESCATEKPDKALEPEQPVREWEIEANQRRKRVHVTPALVIEPPTSISMTSEASQTLDDPLSPPRTPVSPTRAPPPPPSGDRPQVILVSSGTQTHEPQMPLSPMAPPSPRRAPPPPPIAIPSIQIHQPTSAPVTPREHLLPQQFKDAGCQASMQSSISTRSISVQTEGIQVDKRINLLPIHLQPSSISSAPPSPTPSLRDAPRFSPTPGNLPPRNPRRVNSGASDRTIPTSPAEPEIRDDYPGNNDNGPLSTDKGPVRRPPRLSSLFAGFDGASSDDADDFADGDLSENDFRTALSAPKSHSRPTGKRMYTAPTTVPEKMEAESSRSPTGVKSSMKQTSNHDSSNEHSLPEIQSLPARASTSAAKPIRQFDKPLTLASVASEKPGTMRRAALISSGVAAHGLIRSPNLLETALKEPPFPIPTRASSRQPLASASAPSDGSRSPTWGRGVGGGRGHYRATSVRKVRSAAALPRGGRQGRRQGSSRSPPPMSPSTEAPESPGLPPMPYNDVTTPQYMKDTSNSRYRTHRQQPSVTTANTAYTGNTAYTANTANTTNTGSNSVGSSTQATSVVDAIAQTMVGEWMFKYVRRRKSFGVSEPSGLESENGNGVRHKRWVWLAPYERAVMWSSKQPTSGSALLGKSGRKLTIQSVLDVKDDNPSPKGINQLFNRSILILTPARALKFTAISAERHYIWLTALSFLAHSSQAVPEIVAAPLPMPIPTIPDFEIPRHSTKLRKNGIRDSIRVAKGKTAAARPGPTSVHSAQSYPGGQSAREAESFYNPMSSPEQMAADPPVVPRFTDRSFPERNLPNLPPMHGRKRSNTGSRIPPPISFRGFSGPSVSSHAPTSSTAGMSVGTTGSSDIYQSQPSSVAGYTGMSATASIRTSDASARPGNFFDAVGTVRMEAFISPMALSRFDDFPDEQDEMDLVGMHRRRSKERRRRRSRNRDRDSFYSGRSSRPSEDWYGGSKTAGEEEYGHGSVNGNDPFRNF